MGVRWRLQLYQQLAEWHHQRPAWSLRDCQLCVHRKAGLDGLSGDILDGEMGCICDVLLTGVIPEESIETVP